VCLSELRSPKTPPPIKRVYGNVLFIKYSGNNFKLRETLKGGNSCLKEFRNSCNKSIKMKKCYICKVEKEINNFGKLKSAPDIGK
jgi:hypothetical protein